RLPQSRLRRSRNLSETPDFYGDSERLRGCARFVAITALPSIVPTNGPKGGNHASSGSADYGRERDDGVAHGPARHRQGTTNMSGPWAIEAEDVAAYRARNEPQRPLTADSAQGCFD